MKLDHFSMMGLNNSPDGYFHRGRLYTWSVCWSVENLLSKVTSPSFGEWEPWDLVMRIKRGKMVEEVKGYAPGRGFIS